MITGTASGQNVDNDPRYPTRRSGQNPTQKILKVFNEFVSLQSPPPFYLLNGKRRSFHTSI